VDRSFMLSLCCVSPLCRCAGGVKKAIVDNSAEGVIGPLNCVNYSGRAGVKKEAPNTQYGC